MKSDYGIKQFSFAILVVFVFNSCELKRRLEDKFFGNDKHKESSSIITIQNDNCDKTVGLWHCPYCGMYLDPFDVNIVDHKQKKCPDLTSTKHEKDADDIYHEAYEKGKKDSFEEGYSKGKNENDF